jgi:hypothetical protein
MCATLIDRLIIPQNFEREAPAISVRSIMVTVNASMADSMHPGRRLYGRAAFTIEADKDVNALVAKFKETCRVLEFGSCRTLLLRYNNRLYEKSTKLKQLGLSTKATLELISVESEKEAAHNNGFTLAFWSTIPLMLAIAFVASGLIGRFSTIIRGAYVLVGSIIGIPALLCLVVGGTEYFSEESMTAYVNDKWFGPCCKCCKCCVEEEEESVGGQADTSDGAL